MATETSWWSKIVNFVLFFLNNAIYSGFPLIFWVQPRWSVKDMPSQEGKVVLVTGANSGIGFYSAQAFYHAGAKVYMACRSEKKAREAIARIKAEKLAVGAPSSNGELVFLQLDLADLKSVKRAAEDIKSKESRLDILLANAGIMATAPGQYTKQGYTLQTGTNVLGHQALISLLLPLLLSSSQSNPSSPPRVITLSSAGHIGAPRHGFAYHSTLADPDILAKIQQGDYGYEVKRGKQELDSWQEYGQAKWGDIVLAKYLEEVYGPNSRGGLEERRKGAGELITFSVHPGMVDTGLADHFSYTESIKSLTWLAALIVRQPNIGAGNQLWAATMPIAEARRLSGSYIVPFQRIGRPRPDALKRANQVRLWDWCEEQVRKHI